MENRGGRTEPVRWRWVLPALASVITLVLFLQAPYEWSPHEIGCLPPSASIAAILNYPPVALRNLIQSPYYTIMQGDSSGNVFGDVADIVVVVVFWTWIGWAIDTRRRSPRFSSETVRRVLMVVFAIAVAFSGFECWISWRNFRFAGFIEVFRYHINPLFYWSSVAVIGALWFAVGAVYFATKLVGLSRTDKKTIG